MGMKRENFLRSAAFQSPNPRVGLLVYGINYSMGRESGNLKCKTPSTLNLLSSYPNALGALVLWCIRCQSCFIFSPGRQLAQQHTIGDSSLQILQNELKSKGYLFSHVWFFANPWTAACQAPLSMEFSRQEYWSGYLLQGIFLTQGSNTGLLHCRQIIYHLSHQTRSFFRCLPPLMEYSGPQSQHLIPVFSRPVIFTSAKSRR